MPTIMLPADPSLENLRNRARALQRAVRAGDAAALERVAARHSTGVSPDAFPLSLSLSLAQLVIAREHGFASCSWSSARTRAYVTPGSGSLRWSGPVTPRRTRWPSSSPR